MRERKIHQKTIKNETQIHTEIDEKSMEIPCSKKLCTKHKKSTNMDTKSEPKTEKFRFWEVLNGPSFLLVFESTKNVIQIRA
jgi:hypothetical protein